MSPYGVKRAELQFQLGKVVSEAEGAGIASVDIIDALQMMRDQLVQQTPDWRPLEWRRPWAK
jgi:hypothetical protein